MKTPNLKLNARIYFCKDPKDGHLWLRVNLEDEDGKLVGVDGDTRIPLSPHDPNNFAQALEWFFEQVGQRAFDRVDGADGESRAA